MIENVPGPNGIKIVVQLNQNISKDVRFTLPRIAPRTELVRDDDPMAVRQNFDVVMEGLQL